MPSNIQSFAFVLACLVCICQVRRVQNSQENPGLVTTESLAELLLAFQPTVGTRPSVAGARLTRVAPIISEQLAVGSEFPSVEIDFGFPPEKVNMAERVKGKRAIIVGLPGAFTPT
mmetsp:Transcript_100862/g.183931  ORF Transcript_100862/g.183931 Transcript_100862/m.183931 type:complete len:116 (-) Transcript_100862:1131-1478(-)